jgi:hypothetical protein
MTPRNGVLAAMAGPAGAQVALLDGKGKYSKLTFDENRKRTVLLSDREHLHVGELRPSSQHGVAGLQQVDGPGGHHLAPAEEVGLASIPS